MSKSEFVRQWRALPRQWLLSIGIPTRTVDDYRAGTGGPPAWVRERLLRALAEERAKSTD